MCVCVCRYLGELERERLLCIKGFCHCQRCDCEKMRVREEERDLMYRIIECVK